MAAEGKGKGSGRKRKKEPEAPKYGAEETEAAREVMNRALRRLNVLEYFILLLALVLALVGGALVAWVLGRAFGFSFRWTWAGASLLLFIVPGGFAYLRERRNRPASKIQGSNIKTKDPHG